MSPTYCESCNAQIAPGAELCDVCLPGGCTYCGEPHDVTACPDRCELSGGLGREPGCDAHRECAEADLAGRDLPATDALRAEWRREVGRE
jgi:hypothetical protein